MDFTMARLHTALGLGIVGPPPEILPPKDPVWVGRPPALRFNSEDRWGVLHPWPYGTFEVTEPGMMERERFERLKEYQTPVVFDASKVSWTDRIIFTTDWDSVCHETAIGREIKRKMSLPYGRPTTIWEMNLVVRDPDGKYDLMRMMESFGERTIVPWTQFDLLFRLPMLRAQAKHLNQVAAEMREQLGPEIR